MNISVVTDELSSDLDTALELALEFGVAGIELRGIGDSRYPRLSPLDAVRVPMLLRESGLPVVSISPGLFKIPHPGVPAPVSPVDPRVLRWDDALSFADERALAERFQFHLDVLLAQAIDAASAIGCPLINVFSFDRSPDAAGAAAPEVVVETLREAARRAGERGLVLAIENEATTWAGSATAAADLVRRIGASNVGLTWDPANAFRAGDDRPFPAGYDSVRAFVRHVHVKNATQDEAGERRFFFDGEIDWRGQIAALKSDGYSGYLSIETHQRPKLATTRSYLALLRAAIG